MADSFDVDPVAVSYGDVCLRGSDLELLAGPYWLNDRIVNFYFEYLENEKFFALKPRLCFIGAEVTQLIKLMDANEIGIVMAERHLPEKDLVILAVNDQSSPNTSGGSHWSLLVVNIVRSKTPFHVQFHHYDSSAQYNHTEAKAICKKMKSIFSGMKCHDLVEMVTPRQQNGHDCGLYVLCIAEWLCSVKLKGDIFQEQNLRNFVTVSSVANKRQDLLTLINSLVCKK